MVQTIRNKLADMKTLMPRLITLIIILLLAACHDYDDDYYEPAIDGSFKVHSYDGGNPVFIDPYVNDGVFEISWSLRTEYPPVDVLIRLGKSRFPGSGDIVLSDRIYDSDWPEHRFRDRIGFQYTTENELFRIAEDGRHTFLEDLSQWDPYRETFYVHFDACQRKGACYRATERVIFW